MRPRENWSYPRLHVLLYIKFRSLQYALLGNNSAPSQLKQHSIQFRTGLLYLNLVSF